MTASAASRIQCPLIAALVITLLGALLSVTCIPASTKGAGAHAQPSPPGEPREVPWSRCTQGVSQLGRPAGCTLPDTPGQLYTPGTPPRDAASVRCEPSDPSSQHPGPGAPLTPSPALPSGTLCQDHSEPGQPWRQGLCPGQWARGAGGIQPLSSGLTAPPRAPGKPKASVFDLKAITRLLLQPGVLPVFLVKVICGFPIGESRAGVAGSSGGSAGRTAFPLSGLSCSKPPRAPGPHPSQGGHGPLVGAGLAAWARRRTDGGSPPGLRPQSPLLYKSSHCPAQRLPRPLGTIGEKTASAGEHTLHPPLHPFSGDLTASLSTVRPRSDPSEPASEGLQPRSLAENTCEAWLTGIPTWVLKG